MIDLAPVYLRRSPCLQLRHEWTDLSRQVPHRDGQSHIRPSDIGPEGDDMPVGPGLWKRRDNPPQLLVRQ
jgi:hypothetical protein